MNNDRQYITLADKINELLLKYSCDTDKIDIPKMKVVGTQSSGKTSLINNMIGYNALPTGDNMVTRTPLHLRLHTQLGSEYLSLSVIEDGNLVEKLRMSLGELSANPNKLKTSIMEETTKITGTEFTISDIPLFLDLYGSKLPNLSFTDLPGLITIPKTDKGQPESLPYDIEKLVESEISHENTIVLVVIESKPDLETDLGLALVKKLQKKYQSINTIGVLTKPYILNDPEKISNILSGNISSSVSLDNGYFVVNNKDDSKEGYYKFFSKTKSVIENKKCGIINLSHAIQNLLVKKIKETIPNVRKQITHIYGKKKTRLNEIGNKLTEKTDKIKYINSSIQDFVRKLISSITADGYSSVDNVGSKMGRIFDEFEETIENENPFEKIEDSHYTDIINSFRGYKFMSDVSIMTLIQKCLNDEKIKPIDIISNRGNECLYKIINVLLESIGDILNNMTCFDPYPNLKSFFADNVGKLLKSYEQYTLEEINKYVNVEKTSIQSTKKIFSQILKDGNKQDFEKGDKNNIESNNIGFNIASIKNCSKLYYDRVIKSASQRLIIGLIRTHIIQKFKEDISMFLTNILFQQDKLTDDLFTEDNDIEIQRSDLTNSVGELENILQILQTI
jgi:dynamin 1-like protein